MDDTVRGSAISEIAPGHFLLELDQAEGTASEQLRRLLLEPLARQGVRLYISCINSSTFPLEILDRLQALELKFRVHGGGVALICDDPMLLPHAGHRHE
ncbi:MAG: hypothetical protein FJX76_16655 [Armatimonadetes bacterium]|nr:hypothetical protein [Armatimonadota bacterium]